MISSISFHSFTLLAIKKLFLVKTDDYHIFDEKHKERKKKSKYSEPKKKYKGIQKYLSSQFTDYINDNTFKKDVLKTHRSMTLSTWQVIQLFWWNKWNSMFGSCKPIKNKIITLHEHGTQRVLKSFDLVKICNDIKYLKLLAKFQINPSLETQFFIRHSHKSIIYLDEIYKA